MGRSTILIFLFILISVIEVSSSISHDTTLPLKLSTHPKKKTKRTKGSVQYYSNCIATYKLILSGDTELNPGPGLRKPKCKMCKKAVRSNQKHFTREHCFGIIHSKCLNYLNINQSGICPDCLFAALPFYRTNSLNSSVELLQQQSEQQIQQSELLHDFAPYLEMLDQNRNRTGIAHLNTQCLSSAFDDFHVMLNEYQFDIITMSETWLKHNQKLLDYVYIPGYNLEYANRDNKRGGGVGVYIGETFTYTEHEDIINVGKSIEHYWLEISGLNKNSSYLVGIFYQPSSIEHEKRDILKR